MMKFEYEENNGEQLILYPGKVLALLYKDSKGTLKALVHSVEYKTARNVSCKRSGYSLGSILRGDVASSQLDQQDACRKMRQICCIF
jgi:hypothetical protein